MIPLKQAAEQEQQEICFLRESLPLMNAEKLAYLKGASQALLYAQDNHQEIPVIEKKG
jgi:hypothetical protein